VRVQEALIYCGKGDQKRCRALFAMQSVSLLRADESHSAKNPLTSSFRYDVPSPPVGCDWGTETGLYSGIGLVGLLGCLISFFFGFFFSRPRASRLPIMDSLLPTING